MMIKKTILFILASFLLSLTSHSQEGVLTIDSSPEIKKLIASKITYNRESHFVDGYRIQLFYGSESGVNAANAKFTKIFPNYKSYVVYDAPDWKVRVGNFKTRLEADRALGEIILEFGEAIVINYKIRS